MTIIGGLNQFSPAANLTLVPKRGKLRQYVGIKIYTVRNTDSYKSRQRLEITHTKMIESRNSEVTKTDSN